MKKAVLFTALVFGFCGLFSVLIAQVAPVTTQSLNKMPLAFTKNMGQWDERVLFRANAGGATMWFTKEGVTYQFVRRIKKNHADPLSIMDSRLLGLDVEPDSVEQLVISAKFVGANPNPEVVGERLMEYKCNYFIGSDPTQWHTDVPNYEAITIKNIYSGIDLKYSGESDGLAAYELVVAPDADISQINVEFEVAEETATEVRGSLELLAKKQELIAAVQYLKDCLSRKIDGVKNHSGKRLKFESDLENRFASFSADQQELNTSAVKLVYSTYLGGNGGDYEVGLSIAVDDSGCTYIGGQTHSTNFPTQNPLDGTLGGTVDGFVTKVSAEGSSLVYSTYIGGGGTDEVRGIGLDASGCVYATGETYSSDFPTQTPYDGTLSSGNDDAFVAKLSPTGNSLLYSTYLGGNGSDGGGNIAVDGTGCVYVTGWTSSPNFPTNNAYDASFNGSNDTYLTKLSMAGDSLLFSTYLGGTGLEYGAGLGVDDLGCAYISGYTSSVDFPAQNSYDDSYNGGNYDAFIVRFSSAGDSLEYCTFLGGSNTEFAYRLVIDDFRCVYVAGQTASTNLPTQNAFDSSFNGGGFDAFVVKLSADGHSITYCTYLGGAGKDWGFGIGIDGSNSAYITGMTESVNFPTLNPYQVNQNGQDAFVVKISSSGASLTYSTYLGGGGNEAGYDIAIDVRGNAYITGNTWSSDFPIQDPFQAMNRGYDDAFVAKISDSCIDTDIDGVCDLMDNCVTAYNPDQEDYDGDGVGDFCDYCNNILFGITNPGPYTLTLSTYWSYKPSVIDPDDQTHAITYLDLPAWLSASGDSVFGITDSTVITQDTIVIRISDMCNVDSISIIAAIRECGDVDGSGAVVITDVVCLVNWIFGAGCPAFNGGNVADVNCNGKIDISDVVYLVNYIFLSGSAPCAACP